MRFCRKCGVPLVVGKGLVWRDNGTIVQRKDPSHRIIFFESENLEGLFEDIEKSIGSPIEHIIIESVRREARRYVEKSIPAPLRILGHRLAAELIVKKTIDIAYGFGMGRVEIPEMHFSTKGSDHLTAEIVQPRSITLFCGELCGAFEAATGGDGSVEYEQIGDNTYRVMVRTGEHPREFEEYLHVEGYSNRQGDMRFDRCPACKTPLDISRCDWDMQRGLIFSQGTPKRMSLYGPGPIEAVFKDLERELGEDIPNLAVEAQRRYVKNAMGGEAGKEISAYRYMYALRGLGYLSSIESSDGSVTATILNPCVVPILIGTFQGMYELTTGRDCSLHGWSLSAEGDLEVTIGAG